MKLATLCTSFAMLCGCGRQAAIGADAGNAARASHAEDIARVMELERSYWAAEQRHDSATVDGLLAPDYVSMSSQGRGDRSKEAELALLFGGRVHLDAFRFSNMRGVSVAPGVIVLHYLVDQRFSLDGHTRCPHSGSMTVWTQRGARWLRVARTEYAIGGASPVECQE